MSTPINGETFLPTLLVEYLTAVRTSLGLPAVLNIAAWPFLQPFARPQLGISASTFTFIGHPALQQYDLQVLLDYGVEGEPVTGETDAERLTRLQAALDAENEILALVRAALALRPGETLPTDTPVPSIFDWIDDTRVVPAGEDGWALEDLLVSSGGGSLVYDPEKRIRQRLTNYIARLRTNEFTA